MGIEEMVSYIDTYVCSESLNLFNFGTYSVPIFSFTVEFWHKLRRIVCELF